MSAYEARRDRKSLSMSDKAGHDRRRSSKRQLGHHPPNVPWARGACENAGGYDRSQNINKICFSPQVLLPALGWGTCQLLPHFHTRHVPRARLADGARTASFTIFFGHDLPRRSCSSFSDLCALHTHSSVTTCLTANPPLWP